MDKTSIDQLVASLLAETPAPRSLESSGQRSDENGIEQADFNPNEAAETHRYRYTFIDASRLISKAQTILVNNRVCRV